MVTANGDQTCRLYFLFGLLNSCLLKSRKVSSDEFYILQGHGNQQQAMWGHNQSQTVNKYRWTVWPLINTDSFYTQAKWVKMKTGREREDTADILFRPPPHLWQLWPFGRQGEKHLFSFFKDTQPCHELQRHQQTKRKEKQRPWPPTGLRPLWPFVGPGEIGAGS